VYGRFPDKKYRDGKEQVSYEQFYQELINSCCGANLLTYIGKVNLQELYDAGFSLGEVIIPKGNCCGIFSSMYGGGDGTQKRCQAETGSQGLSRIPIPS
jgi:predicted secreted protein